jgi:redox-sensitive bicupin YhaK (pirin superfamily)
MEIVTYVLDGSLEHKDSMGNGSVIVPGDVQRMSAGRGVLHSEYNPSSTERVHFLQIWIEPATRGITPSYEQTNVPAEAKRNRLALIAGPANSGAAVTIHQDARLFATLLDRDASVAHTLDPGRRAYLHVARGRVAMNDIDLGAGDAALITGESAVTIDRGDAGEVLLFDLP